MKLILEIKFKTNVKIRLVFSGNTGNVGSLPWKPFGLATATYLQHAAHPLEAVLLRGVGPLLGHHHDPLVPQHRHGEDRYPAGTETHRTCVTTLLLTIIVIIITFIYF